MVDTFLANQDLSFLSPNLLENSQSGKKKSIRVERKKESRTKDSLNLESCDEAECNRSSLGDPHLLEKGSERCELKEVVKKEVLGDHRNPILDSKGIERDLVVKREGDGGAMNENRKLGNG